MPPGSPANNEQVAQVLLRLQYRQLAAHGGPLPSFSDVEFRCYSQNGEDGILLYLFSILGTVNRKVVEICAGDGIECNAANLIVNHGWQGLLFDGDAGQLSQGATFYSTQRNTWVSPPTLVPAWITAENVNELVSSQGMSGPIDLLSLDIDGNDYWVWKVLDCIKPRVVVLEFNAACGPERSMAMSYSPEYRIDPAQDLPRCGASLQAFVELGRLKGYRLVGVQSLGFNAFFVQNGIGEDLLPEVSALQCFQIAERLTDWWPGRIGQVLSGKERWEDV
jgi:hypothetical protein